MACRRSHRVLDSRPAESSRRVRGQRAVRQLRGRLVDPQRRARAGTLQRHLAQRHSAFQRLRCMGLTSRAAGPGAEADPGTSAVDGALELHATATSPHIAAAAIHPYISMPALDITHPQGSRRWFAAMAAGAGSMSLRRSTDARLAYHRRPALGAARTSRCSVELPRTWSNLVEPGRTWIDRSARPSASSAPSARRRLLGGRRCQRWCTRGELILRYLRLTRRE